MTITQQTLGITTPLTVSSLGLGCMGMSEFYGTPDEQGGLDTIHRALDLGVTFLDTADMYGPFTNEQLVGRAIAGRRDEVQLATKFGNERGANGERLGIDGSPEYVRSACDASLQRLGVDHIDLYYQHRVDPTRADRGDRRRDEGARRGRQGPPPRPLRGRPRDDPPGPRRPPDHGPADGVLAVHARPRGRRPPASSASSASAWSPTPRSGAACSPARSPATREPTARATTGARSYFPRFQGDALEANLALVDQVKALAKEKGCTPGQLALAWVLAQGRRRASSRSPAPSGCTTSRRTSAPPTSR